MFVFQQTGEYFVQAARGMEELAGAELLALGASRIRPAYRGVYMEASDAVAMRVCYESRFASRVLALLARFSVRAQGDVYRHAREIEWHRLFSKKRTFAVTFNVANSVFRNGQYAALLVKDAVCDRFRDEFGTRPDVDPAHPHVLLHLFVDGEHGEIAVDYAGESLHRRGYRTEGGGVAPMQETLAAAVIHYSGYDGASPFWDPMCGSGTLAAEALMRAACIPAGYLRDAFGFFALETFDAAAWKRIRAAANAAMKPLPPGSLLASDADERAVERARANLARLPFYPAVRLQTARFQEMPDFHGGVVVCNPPYGVRMGRQEDVARLYADFGDFLKRHCTGATVWVYVGDRSLLGHFHLKPARKIPLRAGDLDGRLVRFDMF